jgi:putative flippase GtrA
MIRVLRFIIGGGIGAATDLAILYAMTDIFHVWYVISTAVAFIIAFIVSFVLQKYWTFQDHSNDRIHSQIALYFAVAAINTFLNTLLVYLFVNFYNVHYLIGQIIASILIAGESYFIYRWLFRTSPQIQTQ